MECHAVDGDYSARQQKARRFSRQTICHQAGERDLCAYKNEYFLNPGHPATKEYLMRLVREVVDRYDIDGVHFDYLRYPENAPLFPDKYDFRRYSKGRTWINGDGITFPKSSGTYIKV